jgi:hypothetical protein
MAITFTCQCGQRFSAPDEAQGKATKCPKCGASLTVPRAEPARPQASPPPSGPPPLHDVAGVAEAAPVMPAPAGPAPGPLTPSPLRPRPDRRAWIIAGTGLAICYWALIVGGIAFGIMGLFIIVGTADPSALVSVFGAAGTGRFAAMILPWCVLALLASSAVLVTGWLVCFAIPERTGARQLVQGSVACVGIAVGVIVLLQVVALVTTPSMPDRGDPFAGGFGTRSGEGRPSSPAETQKSQQEFMEAVRKGADAAKTMATIGNVLTWLAALAVIASSALFGFFLGAVGQHLGRSALRAWSYGLGGALGVMALCVTLLAFVVSFSTPASMVKSLLVLTTLLQLTTYGALIYMVYQTRRVVPAD